MQRAVDITGTLHGQEEAAISAKVGGRIVDVFKDIGDRAAPGEPLAQIEQTDYELAMNKAEMAVRETLAQLGLVALPTADFNVSSVPTVRSAQLQADNAQSRYNRGRQLHDSTPPLISDQDFADLKTAADVARTNLEVQVLGAGARLAEARTRQSEYLLARQRVTDTTVRTPVPAATQPATRPYAITARLVSDGEYVREGTPLFRLIEDDPLKLRSSVPERFGPDIRIGQRVALRIEGVPREVWGLISRINPQVDLATRTFQIEAVVPNADRSLKAGAFVRASVQTHIDPSAVVVPESAINRFAGVAKVFTVKDGKAQEIRVETGIPRDGVVEITRGLKGGEPIVVSAAGTLATGVPLDTKAATRPTH